MIFELAVFHPDSLQIAQDCEVSRIELCDNYQVGGVTPSINYFKEARRIFTGPIRVMIRPIAGGFVYNDATVLQMQEEIKLFDNLGADGFVLGCLTNNHDVNASQLAMLVKAAKNKPVTFHRAIDDTTDYENAINTLINCGVSGVLTTGKSSSALEGKNKIEEMMLKYGPQLTFIAGGGVRSKNVLELLANSHISEIHSAAITTSIDYIADQSEVLAIIEKVKG